MHGTSTLSELYLGSDPSGVSVEDDQLQVMLADGRRIGISFELASQLMAAGPLPQETQLLIVRNPARVDHIRVTDSALNVYLKDGRLLSCPLAWFPRLLHGSAGERNHYQLSGDEDVIHWPDLDEDIELARLFQGGRSVESERSIQRWLLSRQSELVSELAIT